MTPNPAYRAGWNKVHMAVIRDELWSPACSDERGWVAPLADPTLAGQITCKVCHPLAMARNTASQPSQGVTKPCMLPACGCIGEAHP